MLAVWDARALPLSQVRPTIRFFVTIAFCHVSQQSATRRCKAARRLVRSIWFRKGDRTGPRRAQRSLWNSDMFKRVARRARSSKTPDCVNEPGDKASRHHHQVRSAIPELPKSSATTNNAELRCQAHMKKIAVRAGQCAVGAAFCAPRPCSTVFGHIHHRHVQMAGASPGNGRAPTQAKYISVKRRALLASAQLESVPKQQRMAR